MIFDRKYQNYRSAWNYRRAKREEEKKTIGYWHKTVHELGHCICFVRTNHKTQVIFTPGSGSAVVEPIRAVGLSDEAAHEEAYFKYNKLLNAE